MCILLGFKVWFKDVYLKICMVKFNLGVLLGYGEVIKKMFVLYFFFCLVVKIYFLFFGYFGFNVDDLF